MHARQPLECTSRRGGELAEVSWADVLLPDRLHHECSFWLKKLRLLAAWAPVGNTLQQANKWKRTDAHCAEKANAVVEGHQESHETPGQTRMQGGVTLCSTQGGWQSQALIDTHQLRRPRSRQSMDWSSEKAALKFKHTQDGPKQDSTRRCFQLVDPQILDDARRALYDVAAEVVASPLGSGCSCPAQKRLRCCTHRAAMVDMPQRPGPALRLVAVMCGWCRRRTNVAHHPPNLRGYQPQFIAVHSCALETTSPATSLPLTHPTREIGIPRRRRSKPGKHRSSSRFPDRWCSSCRED